MKCIFKILVLLIVCTLLSLSIGGAITFAVTDKTIFDWFEKEEAPQEEPEKVLFQNGDKISTIYIDSSKEIPLEFFESLQYIGEVCPLIGYVDPESGTTKMLIGAIKYNGAQDSDGNQLYALIYGGSYFFYSSGNYDSDGPDDIVKGWREDENVNVLHLDTNTLDIGQEVEIGALYFQDQWYQYFSKEPIVANNN